MSSNYTFSTNVPQSNQKISATQQPIQNNFGCISDFFDTNHVGFYDPVNYGKHIYTSFPEQVSDPSTTSSEMAVYSKAVDDSNGIELFARYPSDGMVVQLTGGGFGGLSSENGYSNLTTSLTMQWGLATINTTGSTTVSFTTPFTTSIFSVNFTPAGNYTQSYSSGIINNLTLTTFQFNAPSGGMSSTIYWIAMGF